MPIHSCAIPTGQMVLGIDLGDTIVYRDQPGGLKHAFPDAVEVIAELVQCCREVHIVSRVNPEQEVRAKEWLKNSRFHEITGLAAENVHFCRERCEKAPICERLKITHFIDDRPEVMSHLREDVIKILHRPNPEDLARYSPKLKNWVAVENWKQIRQLLFSADELHKAPPV